jgi:phosphoribosylaminoimidazole-succinocarboxamide synthase
MSHNFVPYCLLFFLSFVFSLLHIFTDFPLIICRYQSLLPLLISILFYDIVIIQHNLYFVLFFEILQFTIVFFRKICLTISEDILKKIINKRGIVMKPIKEGKVREIYDNGDSLIMVATDRISCFDVILKNVVSKKGTVLTQMSKFWFDLTKDILPNHMISTDVKDMPEFFQKPEYDGNSMMCKKLEMLPIECIVRGYITGSGWKSYKENGTVCGIKLPEGLKESDKLPEPIYTPSTKAEIGDHDENISYEQSIAHLEKYFPGKGEEYAAKLRDCTIALYKKCADYALSRGIIIADTKFEFGLDENGNMVIGDEMLTPDSSRFWPVEGYESGHGQPSFDKQFARDWLTSHPDNDWTLPDDVVQKTIDKYLQCYKMITGEELA